jgi:hypothetical protein
MMDNLSLYKYLKSSSSEKYFIELLQYEINKIIYYYGENFIRPWKSTKSFKYKVLVGVHNIYRVINSSYNKHQNPEIFSNAYFNLNSLMKDKGVNIVIPFWSFKRNGQYIANIKYQRLFNRLNRIISKGSVGELISTSTFALVDYFIKESKIIIRKRNFIAAFFSNDLGFFDRLFIDIFKQLDIPTFIFLHGLPGRYNIIDDNRADYLIVWGNQIKQNFINKGVKEEKIIVSGHPLYKKEILSTQLRFDLKNIVVLSRPISGSPSSSNQEYIDNKGTCIVYLLILKKCLIKFGVSNVTLCPHPSEDPNWYSNQLNDDFFTIGSESLPKLLKKSSLVIGPTSTVFLESLYYGVNYLVFEPIDSNISLVDPFDGSNDKIPIAKNEWDLYNIIENKIEVERSVFSEYISADFNIDRILKYAINN